MTRPSGVWLAILVALVVLATLAASLREWIRLLREKLGDSPPLRGFLRRLLRAVLLAAGVVLVACLAYARFIEPWRLEITHATIVMPHLPPGTKPIRVALFSDLHCERHPRLEDVLPNTVAAEHPDAIVFTGDSLNTLDGLRAFRLCMARMAGLAPTFAVRGNWDTGPWAKVDLFQGTGVRELDGVPRPLDAAGVRLYLTGIAYSHSHPVRGVFRGVPAGAPVIFLYHSPELADQVAAMAPDLYLAGHTHGGQVDLPGYGAVVTLCPTGKRFEAGLYKVGPTSLYVTRGIGMAGGLLPRLRFLCRPELTILDLVPPS